MIRLLIGHRGVGKTSFLKGLELWAQARKQALSCKDLDQELVERTGHSIDQLIDVGEPFFRQLESETLAELVREASGPTVIALGAGFAGPIPENTEVIWLRRETDSLGRSFLNRPRLDIKTTPHLEYMDRFATREARFREWADQQVLLPEGYNGGMEDWIMDASIRPLNCARTLIPEDFKSWQRFYQKWKHWQLQTWELRDDLLSSEQMCTASASLSADRILFSYRDRRGLLAANGKFKPSIGVRQDWGLELGEPPGMVNVLSRHERGHSIAKTLTEFSSYADRADILKLAVEIGDFEELLQGHRWWLADPSRRSFLPRSSDGRWRWYRSLFGPAMPLHFVRASEGTALDQPTVWQTLYQTKLQNGFAAVLGHPVRHSRTPVEHLEFFARREMPVVAIEVKEPEFELAFPVLKEMGLKCAAVTAPLKTKAFAIANQLTDEARRAEAVNTLWISAQNIVGHNTDILALEVIGKELPDYKSVWLWGGGGIKPSVRAVWSEVRSISARMGISSNPPSASPDLLIWATGRSRVFVMPPNFVRPRLILDLNYGDDSPGLEWAVAENLPYQSGLRMFKLQAEGQRQFWQGMEAAIIQSEGANL